MQIIFYTNKHHNILRHVIYLSKNILKTMIPKTRMQKIRFANSSVAIYMYIIISIKVWFFWRHSIFLFVGIYSLNKKTEVYTHVAFTLG